MYKVISKVLVGRLKSVLGIVISDNQSAFLIGRHILDGVVAPNEMIEDAKITKSLLIFKVHFTKTFDWKYLREMISRMELPDKWIDWMNMCFSTA